MGCGPSIHASPPSPTVRKIHSTNTSTIAIKSVKEISTNSSKSTVKANPAEPVENNELDLPLLDENGDNDSLRAILDFKPGAKKIPLEDFPMNLDTNKPAPAMISSDGNNEIGEHEDGLEEDEPPVSPKPVGRNLIQRVNSGLLPQGVKLEDFNKNLEEDEDEPTEDEGDQIVINPGMRHSNLAIAKSLSSSQGKSILSVRGSVTSSQKIKFAF